MNRGVGTGLIAFGAVLGVVGAIMRYAVQVHTGGFNVHMAGVILLIVGIGLVLLGLIAMVLGGRSKTTRLESVESTPGGQVRTSEQDVRASIWAQDRSARSPRGNPEPRSAAQRGWRAPGYGLALAGANRSLDLASDVLAVPLVFRTDPIARRLRSFVAFPA